MATATVTLSADPYPYGIDQGQRFIYVRGEAAVSASPATYATGGLALNFAPLTGMDGGFSLPVSPGDVAAPVDVHFVTESGSGWVYVWNRASNTLQILAASGGVAGTAAPFEEMTSLTAIPATVSGDTIRYLAVFLRER